MGAADERLDPVLEEARATSMPPAVKRVGTAPAAIEARRSSAAAAGRADGDRQNYGPAISRGVAKGLWTCTPRTDTCGTAAF